MAQPNKPKTMSSRLMTMKFMQRGNVSSPPSTPPEPPAKKQRLSNISQNSITSTPHSKLASHEEPVQTPGFDRGETKWYLSFQDPSPAETPLRIVEAGYAALDTDLPAQVEDGEIENEDEFPSIQGRRNFGNFNRKTKREHSPSPSDSASSESEEDEEPEENNSDDPTGAQAFINQARREAAEKARVERKAKRKAEKAESTRLAEERRKKRVKLNTLSSISGGGGTPRSSERKDLKEMTCFKCGEKGHIAKECTRSSERRDRRS